MEQIDRLESRGDTIERDMIRTLFQLKIDTAEKILIRDIIRHIGDISDKAQSAADRIAIAVIKRRM